MRPLPIEALGKKTPYVRGLALVRGRPIPVVDAGALIGFTEDAHPRRWITLRIGERYAALEVEDILGVHSFEATEQTALPPLLETDCGEHIATIGIHDTELLLILRSTRLIPEEVWQSLEQERSQG